MRDRCGGGRDVKVVGGGAGLGSDRLSQLVTDDAGVLSEYIRERFALLNEEIDILAARPTLQFGDALPASIMHPSATHHPLTLRTTLRI